MNGLILEEVSKHRLFQNYDNENKTGCDTENNNLKVIFE